MRITKPNEILVNFSMWRTAVAQASAIPFWIVFTIALYTPFEEFILKWIPGSSLLRFIPELLLYLTLIFLLKQKRFNVRSLRSTPIDLVLLLFIISICISIIANGSSLMPSVVTLRPLFRYTSVFYIIVNISISLEQLKLMLNGIRVVGLVQGALASFLYFMPTRFQAVFAPREFTLGSYERSEIVEGDVKVGAIYGMFPNPAALLVFLLLALIVSLGKFNVSPGYLLAKLQELASFIVLFFGIYATKKRAALLIAFMIPLALLFFRRKIKTLLKLGWLYAVVVLIAFVLLITFGSSVDTSFSGSDAREQTVDVTSYFLQLFSPEYYEQSSESSRGWVIGTTVSSLIKSGSWFGFGPDVDHAREIIHSLLVDGADRTKILTLQPLEDVYWFAMLAYYGPIGLGCYIFMLWQLFRSGQRLYRASSHPEHKALGALFCTLLLFLCIYNFIERIVELRGFSYYFWLIAGLVVNASKFYKAPDNV